MKPCFIFNVFIFDTINVSLLELTFIISILGMMRDPRLGKFWFKVAVNKPSS